MQFPINITARPARTVRSVPRTSARRRRMGSTALWTIEGALAAIFLFAGVSKLVMPAETLTQGTGLPALFLRFIEVCETLGAAGLVLPGVLRMHRELTPIAAAGLVAIMAGAASITVATMRVGAAAFPCVVGILALIIAVKRPIGSSRTVLRA